MPMPHHTSLIAMLVAGFVLAFILGALAHRLRLSPLVGYLAAGVLVGPFTPGFVGDQELAPQLAEIGVILLMFGVGLHFSLRDHQAAVRSSTAPMVQCWPDASWGSRSPGRWAVPHLRLARGV
jgi:predicted Kef-type K+ transport protein